jgi:hypothetical protein
MIECKTPKIDPIAKHIKKSLSTILKIDVRKIGVTSTSGENLTLFGAGLGIQCFAIVALLTKGGAKPAVKKSSAKKPSTKKPARKPKKKK